MISLRIQNYENMVMIDGFVDDTGTTISLDPFKNFDSDILILAPSSLVKRFIPILEIRFLFT